ncbi:MAG: DNA primase large subunit PriL [Methanocalculaceae archaeon]|jgi:DNA primase large subunit|nr:DNA primase large subunit PriL [Methanocalculaceae archaeon]
MRLTVEPRDLTHYPFLKDSQEFLAARGIKIRDFTASTIGRKYLDAAIDRIVCAIDGKEIYPESQDVVADIATYVLARVLVSCVKDRNLIERLVRMEARRVYFYIHDEENEKLKNHVCETLGITFDLEKISVIKYVELTSTIREPKWRLINRDVDDGLVTISDDEQDILLRERIKFFFDSQLPLTIPLSVEHELMPWCDKITATLQERTFADFGVIDESAYPPCIQALIAGAAAGVNLSHSGRFATTTFLNNISMTPTQIVGVFARSPDFNPDMTLYQVDQITTHEYTTPACQTMLTHGICVNRDHLCDKITHPLNYYRSKKKLLERKHLRDEAKTLASSEKNISEKLK